jgi:hypothetical protein
LKKGGKYSAFDKHRQFLEEGHPFREDKKNFKKAKLSMKLTRYQSSMVGLLMLSYMLSSLRPRAKVLWDMDRRTTGLMLQA